MTGNTDDVLVILARDWRVDQLTGAVTMRCPCCGQVSQFADRGVFDINLRHVQGRVIVTTVCGCLTKQRLHLDDYHELKSQDRGGLAA